MRIANIIAGLALGLLSLCSNAHSKVPKDPEIENLIKQLGSKNEKERAEAEKLLRASNKPHVFYYLVQALRSPENDAEAKLSIRKLLATIEKKLPYATQSLERVRDYAGKGKIDLAVELLIDLDPPAYDPKFWATVVDVRSNLTRKANEFYVKDFKNPVLNVEPNIEEFIRNRKMDRFRWVAGRHVSGFGRDFEGAACANVGPFRNFRGIAVSRSPLISEVLSDSAVLSLGITGGRPAVLDRQIIRDSLLIDTGRHDAVQTRLRIENSIVICLGKLPMIDEVNNSIVISSEAMTLDPKIKKIGTCIIKEKEPRPLDFIQWFETAQIGIECSLVNDKVVIAKLDANQAFAKAGCKVGDEVDDIDGAKILAVENVRWALRRAVIQKKTTLTLNRDKKSTKISVDLPE